MRLAVFAFMLVLAHTACSTATEPESLVGTFALQSVNGLPLPYTVRETATRKEELTAMTLTFAGGDRYTLEIWTRVTQAGFIDNPFETRTGKWHETGAGVVLIPDDVSGDLLAFRMGDTLSMEDKGEQLVFRRQ